jgi:hypothetical protein
MATDKVLVDGVTANNADVIETIYTVPTTSGTLIKAVTASNPTNINASYSMYIVGSDGDTSLPEIPNQIVVRLKADLAPSVVNHVIPKGGTLRISTSAANSISFRVTGIEL